MNVKTALILTISAHQIIVRSRPVLQFVLHAEKSLDPSWLSNDIVKKFAKGGAVAYEGY